MQIFANKKIEEYSNEMPLELRRVVGALNDKLRLAIFFVLLKYGELSFSQIMNVLEIPQQYSSKLTYHLKKLEKAALIKNEYTKKENSESYSFYDLTEFAEELLKGLMNTIALPESIRNNDAIETKPMEIDNNPYINNKIHISQPEFNLDNIQDLLDIGEGILDNPLLTKGQVAYIPEQPFRIIYNINIKNLYVGEQKDYLSQKKVVVGQKNTKIYNEC